MTLDTSICNLTIKFLYFLSIIKSNKQLEIVQLTYFKNYEKKSKTKIL